jgi:hypothetical protein
VALASITTGAIISHAQPVEFTQVEAEPAPIVQEEEPEEIYFVDERTEAKHEIERLELVARVVCSESGNQPFVGKVAVATTVINRSEHYSLPIEDIVNAPKQYVCGLYYTEECMDAVEFAINNRELFPRDMMWFRTGHYHDFGKPYVMIEDHYFSKLEDKQ